MSTTKLSQEDWEVLAKIFANAPKPAEGASEAVQAPTQAPTQALTAGAPVEPVAEQAVAPAVAKKRRSTKKAPTSVVPAPAPASAPAQVTTAVAPAYIIPPCGPKSTLEKKLEYLEACAAGDPSVMHSVTTNGKTYNRKKGYRQWYTEQYGTAYDGKTFNVKDQGMNARKLYQGTIMKEAYKRVKENPALKGVANNNVRLKVMSGAMKTFEHVYKDPNFKARLNNPNDVEALINSCAQELSSQIAIHSKK